MPPIHFDVAVLIAATVTGFVTYRKNDPLYLRLMRFFLLVDLIAELGGEMLKQAHRSNVLLFSIYSIIELSFLLYFFRETIYGTDIRKKIRVLQFVMPPIYLVNLLFVQGPRQFNTYTYSLGSLVLVALGVLYLYRLFRNKDTVNLLREPAFWISVGVIFFYTSALSMVGVINYVNEFPPNVIRFVLKLIQSFAVFFYLLFIIAFLCRRNTRKS